MDIFFHLVPDVIIHDESKYENMCVKKTAIKMLKTSLPLAVKMNGFRHNEAGDYILDVCKVLRLTRFGSVMF
jgi:hypothetical protein